MTERAPAGSLRAANAGERVRVCGWVHAAREMGGKTFLDVRDSTGVVQVVPAAGAPRVRREWVVEVVGEVAVRPQANPDLPTGEVEVAEAAVVVLNEAETPPIYVDRDDGEPDDIRYQHRYLDLRRPERGAMLRTRHAVVKAIRCTLEERGFTEVETPVLTRSTPEGARDFLVPSREQKGKWYALPQSPQLFKQVLMGSGVERYYQIAKCFRDEDLRGNRQPEFTQLDFEMAFADEEEVLAVGEEVFRAVLAAAGEGAPEGAFPRLTYAEAIAKYGLDKPDLRYPAPLHNLAEHLGGAGIRFVDAVLEAGGSVPGLAVAGLLPSRKEVGSLEETAKAAGAGGLAWAVRKGGEWRGGISGMVAEQGRLDGAARECGLEGDGALLLAAGEGEAPYRGLGAVHRRLRDAGALGEPAAGHALCWVTEFPLFVATDDGGITACHHPFTLPREGDAEKIEGRPLAVGARSYDLVLDGEELGSGSVRCHNRDLQLRILAAMGYGEAEVAERFGFFLEMMRYGLPPHAGLAVGIDRVAALLSGAGSIRDVIAFPKTAKGVCFLTGAPGAADPASLEGLEGLLP